MGIHFHLDSKQMKMQMKLAIVVVVVLQCYAVYGAMQVGTQPVTIDDPKKDDDGIVTTMGADDEKVWLFGMEGNYEPYIYLDSNTGAARGMIYDMISDVCSRCGVKCDMVYIDTFGNRCYDAAQLSAPSLNDLHYDACAGWGRTIQRMNMLNFSAPYMSATRGQMYRRSDASDTINSNIKIGFRKDYYMDQFCAKNNGYSFNDDNMVMIDGGWDDLTAALNNNQIQWALMGEGKGTNSIIAMGSPFDCTDGGLGHMARKDTDLSWWDACFDDYRNSGEFNMLCQRYPGVSRCL